jgi:large subunit ribosomal protein L4
VVSTLVTGETPKTKAALEALRKITQAPRVLVVVDEADELTWMSLRNAPEVHLLDAGQLNTYDVLVHDDVVFTQEAYDQVVARLSQGGKEDA